MIEVDRAIIAALEAEGIRVGNGYIATDQDADAFEPGDPNEPTVITVELPYAVLYSNFGDDYKRRLSGFASKRSVFWQITYVGSTVDQVKWAQRRGRRALARRLDVLVYDEDTDEPTGEKYETGLIDIEESQRVRRDDATVDPNGDPLFYGVDTHSVKVTKKR